MYKIDQGIRDALKASLAAGITEEAMKGIKKDIEKVVCSFENDLNDRIRDDLAHNLAGWTADMAERAIEQILAGNEDQLRRYLSCDKRRSDGQYIGWTGRSDGQVYGRKYEDHEQHPIIHGELFERGAIELRKKIVDAHPELLKNERILDLEDQVKSLVAQVNKANAEREEMWVRCRGVL